MKFELELESKRMEEERMRRKSDQEHEFRMFQMIVSLSKPHQYPYAANASSFFPQVPSGQPVPNPMFGVGQPQASQSASGGVSIDGSVDTRYDVLANMNFS